MAQIRINGEEAREEVLTVLASNYPKEIKGVDKIEQKGREVHIHTATPTRGHKADRYIRVSEDFNLDDLKEMIRQLQGMSENYIKDVIKNNYGKSIRQLRHELADSQLEYGLTQVGRALGHNSKKNMAYYLDYIKIAEEKGIDEALKLINGTEDKRLFSLIRLAIRVELEIFRECKV